MTVSLTVTSSSPKSYCNLLLAYQSVCVCMHAQSCLTFCNPVDCSPPGSSVHGILQARILEWVAISFSRGSSQPRDRTWSPTLQADSLLSEPPGKPSHMKVKGLVTPSCPTLCDPMDCSPPGSSVHGISQARVLEWVAISFSRGSSLPRD